jgi:hypothetical protein
VTDVVTVTLPPELVEAIAQRVAQIMLARQRDESPWMTRREAAGYLRVPVSRLEKDKTIPCRHWGGRVLYHRAQLDEWLGVDADGVTPYSAEANVMARRRANAPGPDKGG